jgi:hypothetical protein
MEYEDGSVNLKGKHRAALATDRLSSQNGFVSYHAARTLGTWRLPKLRSSLVYPADISYDVCK